MRLSAALSVSAVLALSACGGRATAVRRSRRVVLAQRFLRSGLLAGAEKG